MARIHKLSLQPDLLCLQSQFMNYRTFDYFWLAIVEISSKYFHSGRGSRLAQSLSTSRIPLCTPHILQGAVRGIPAAVLQPLL